MTWNTLETNTHQDHVIAHVVGATPLGYFVWDETAFILLDIGFIWIVYLDLQMGLVPHPVAITELEADEPVKTELRSDVDLLLRGDLELSLMKPVNEASPIVTVELLESGNRRRLSLVCEERNFVLQFDTQTAQIIFVQSV